VLMKNWEPPVLGPALAMLSVPAWLLIFAVCSSGIDPSLSLFFDPCPGTLYVEPPGGPPVPHRELEGAFECGHPNCSMKSLITRWK